MKRKTARKKKNNNNYTFKGGFFGRKISPEDEVPKRKLYDILKDAERKYREKVKSQEKDAKVKGLAKKNGPQNISATKSPEFEIESKVYPLPFVNSKGFRIGNYKVFVNTDLLPFTGLLKARMNIEGKFQKMVPLPWPSGSALLPGLSSSKGHGT